MLHLSFFLLLHLFRSSCCLDVVSFWPLWLLVLSFSFYSFCVFVFLFCCSCQISSIKEAPVRLNARHQEFYEGQTHINLMAQELYEPKGPKLLWTQGTKSFMNLRLRPQKFYEPQVNHVACSANASGEALRPPPNRTTSSARTAHPHLKCLHLQLKPYR